MEKNWTSCFLCVYDKEGFKCTARDEKVDYKTQDLKCKDCPYHITANEARQKILFALGLIKHIEE